MTDLQRILGVIDPKHMDSPALTQSLDLARRANVPLDLRSFDYNKALVRSRMLAPDMLDSAIDSYRKREIAAIREVCDKKSDVPDNLSVDAIWDPKPVRAMLREIVELGSDMVVKDIEAISSTRRLFLTPQDWKLIRLCPAPLLLAHPQGNPAPKRIMVAVDPLRSHNQPEDLDLKAIEQARRLADFYQAELHLAHAFEVTIEAMEVLFDPGMLDTADHVNTLREEHRGALLKFAEAQNIPVEYVHFVEGAPQFALARLANDLNIDLLVLNGIARRGLKRLLLGSTAEQILPEVGCNVLVLKPEDVWDLVRKELEINEEEW